MTEASSLRQTLHWVGGADGHLTLIDQTRLPAECVEIACRDTQSVWQAIRTLQVRGAPAIGIAAAFGLCLAVRDAGNGSESQFFQQLSSARDYLASSRPTAVNLSWALDRVQYVADRGRGRVSLQENFDAMLREAYAIQEEDRQTCRAIGAHGAARIADGASYLTHCNAGGLATSDYGTALACFFAARDQGKRIHVFVDETRPLLQGSRLTAWELEQRGIDCTLICDSMAAQVMKEGRVQGVFVGADRIAANGDTANKIGTYGLAVLAQAHGLPFYVAAPLSTFDLSITSGAAIPIEQRPAEEITHGFGRATAPPGVHVYNPAFDVTPAALIRGIVCECGVIEPVNSATITDRIAESLDAASAPEA